MLELFPGQSQYYSETDRCHKFSWSTPKKFAVVPIAKASNNVVIGHRNNTSSKANNSCDEIKDENTEYRIRLGFKVTELSTTKNVLNF